MLYTIKNEALKVVIDNHGAELYSIQTLDGTEYLWQGDPAVWNGQAPNLFPYVARLTDQKYTFEGKEYSMKIHGFINAVDLYVETEERDRITFRYDSGEETLTQYPFPFIYRITYLLDGHTLKITNKVENIGEKRMYFGLGGHPGFNVPLEEGLSPLRIIVWSFQKKQIHPESSSQMTATEPEKMWTIRWKTVCASHCIMISLIVMRLY